MRGELNRATGTSRRHLSGNGQQHSATSRAVRALVASIGACVLLIATAPHRAAAQATTAPSEPLADRITAAAAAATAPTTAPGGAGAAPGRLIVSGLDEATGSVRLLVNKSTTLVTSRPFKRVISGQPDVIEVNPIGATRILVIAKKAGATQLTVWDEDDNQQQIDVLVQANLLALRSMYERLLPGSKIEVHDENGIVALTGQVATLEQAEQATALAAGFGQRVLNLLEVAGGQQVMLQVRFAEVSKSATSALGVNFAYTDGVSFGGSNVGNIAPFSVVDSDAVQDAIRLGVPAGGSAVTQFGSGMIGGTAFNFFVSALRENNLLRVLAEPNLVAISGQEANFLAGGEFPIPIVQGGNDQGTSVTVEFKEFGVRLKFVPVVLGNGRIRLKLAPEVSDVDFTNAVITSGFRVPGTRTRRLSTVVELEEGQTFAVGGLLDNRVAANKAATPLLGDIPVLGALFRSVRYQRQETELVVLVTPRLVAAVDPGNVPKLPGEHWRHPNEFGLYAFGDIGEPVKQEEAVQTPPRRFIGRYGFVPAP